MSETRRRIWVTFMQIYLSVNRWLILIPLALAFAPVHATVGAEEPPYMEAGIGLVGQYIADYRGSSHYQLQALPLPYLIFEGRIFKADKDGVRGEFFKRARFELDVSLAGSLNGDSDNNPLREGMPELLSSVEVGPSFNIKLTGDEFRQGWSLRLPVRAVIGVDFSGYRLDYLGYLANPRLTWKHPDIGGGWRLSTNLGFTWADRNLHSYYYDVAPEFATPARPAFDTGSGFSGTFLRVSGYKQLGDWRVGLSLNYDNLAHTAFFDSPLVETEHFFSLSFALVRTLWSNRSRVDNRSVTE